MPERQPKTCPDCGRPIDHRAVRCARCAALLRHRTGQAAGTASRFTPDSARAAVQRRTERYRQLRALERSLELQRPDTLPVAR